MNICRGGSPEYNLCWQGGMEVSAEPELLSSDQILCVCGGRDGWVVGYKRQLGPLGEAFHVLVHGNCQESSLI